MEERRKDDIVDIDTFGLWLIGEIDAITANPPDVENYTDLYNRTKALGWDTEGLIEILKGQFKIRDIPFEGIPFHLQQLLSQAYGESLEHSDNPVVEAVVTREEISMRVKSNTIQSGLDTYQEKFNAGLHLGVINTMSSQKGILEFWDVGYKAGQRFAEADDDKSFLEALQGFRERPVTLSELHALKTFIEDNKAQAVVPQVHFTTD